MADNSTCVLLSSVLVHPMDYHVALVDYMTNISLAYLLTASSSLCTGVRHPKTSTSTSLCWPATVDLQLSLFSLYYLHVFQLWWVRAISPSSPNINVDASTWHLSIEARDKV